MNNCKRKNKLLFITQKIHKDDDDLAFVIQWVDEFIKQGMDVQVICLEKGNFDDHFSVYSLGKEKGLSRWIWVINFYKLIFSLKYDKVFVHMNQEWSALGSLYWWVRNKPFYLWYTHYTMTFFLRVTGWFVDKMFCATAQSLPQYNNSSKKIVTRHGIDLNFWQVDNLPTVDSRSKYNLLTVHRICRSKRLEIVIKALKYLPKEYNLTIYGRDVEKDYAQELRSLVKEFNFDSRVKFIGSVPTYELKNIYSKYRLMVNMASETIDKTKLEGMYFGVYPITTKANSLAIGLQIYPEHDGPKTIANFILKEDWKKYDLDYLQNIVRERHSLNVLVKNMLRYINK
jgi:glycosyltransferase involved in cell wall biosynthesis